MNAATGRPDSAVKMPLKRKPRSPRIVGSQTSAVHQRGSAGRAGSRAVPAQVELVGGRAAAERASPLPCRRRYHCPSDSRPSPR